MRAGDGSVDRIVETKYTEGLSEEELAIREVNIGTYAFEAADLWPALDAVGEERGELYLTGVFPALRENGRTVAAHVTADVAQRHGREQPRRPDGGRGGGPAPDPRAPRGTPA